MEPDEEQGPWPTDTSGFAALMDALIGDWKVAELHELAKLLSAASSAAPIAVITTNTTELERLVVLLGVTRDEIARRTRVRKKRAAQWSALSVGMLSIAVGSAALFQPNAPRLVSGAVVCVMLVIVGLISAGATSDAADMLTDVIVPLDGVRAKITDELVARARSRTAPYRTRVAVAAAVPASLDSRDEPAYIDPRKSTDEK